MSALTVGSVQINVAEFLAILVTCETFTFFCAGRMTTVLTDNVTAQAWFKKGRCPHFPFDRCAQGLHLYTLKYSMILRASWIRSGDNTLADCCLRQHFPMNRIGHNINGIRLLRVKPKWVSVIKYL